MRFKIHQVWTAQELLDFAFKTTRQSTPDLPKKIRKKERWAKEIEKNKIEQVANLLEEKMRSIPNSFPQFETLEPFYQELLDASIDIDKTRRQLGTLKKNARIIQQLRSQTIRQIFQSKSIPRIRKLSQSFYGRTSSIVKRLDKTLKELEKKRKQLLALPNIQTDCYTVVLAGFPNVGKTTLLKLLTESEPRIAPFPFTTQGLKIGYLKENWLSVQFIDTPGLLDRPLEKRNPIEKRALAALNHLGETILFVVDPSLSSGFSLEKQFSLWKQIQTQFKSKQKIAIITKIDLTAETEHKKALEQFSTEFSSENLEKLKKTLLEKAKKWFKKTPPDPHSKSGL
ncbi:50S ribosome-binding GTPase [Candidatus Micrarchaeota archaeon]|nr:50S ribosome-binding GTPase [Candidatus Micrarchaeota archaeon]MBU1930352.1 50S ribosome-binding GTPase [Candidatus Micrarchaeota archaeon]